MGNLHVLDINLISEDLRRIEENAPRGAAASERYPEHMLRLVNA